MIMGKVVFFSFVAFMFITLQHMFYVPPDYQGDLLSEVNEYRTSLNLQPLTESKELNNLAKNKCMDMMDRDYFDHVDPDGKNVWSKLNNYKIVGENLAEGFGNAEDTLEAWKASETHNENLVETMYKEIGHGICWKNKYLIVQVFRG